MDFDPHVLGTLVGSVFNHQVTQFCLAFGVAAWIHSSRVKIEFKNITDAINNLSVALRQDLKIQEDRIGRLETDVKSLKGVNNVNANS